MFWATRYEHQGEQYLTLTRSGTDKPTEARIIKIEDLWHAINQALAIDLLEVTERQGYDIAVALPKQ